MALSVFYYELSSGLRTNGVPMALLVPHRDVAAEMQQMYEQQKILLCPCPGYVNGLFPCTIDTMNFKFRGGAWRLTHLTVEGVGGVGGWTVPIGSFGVVERFPLDDAGCGVIQCDTCDHWLINEEQQQGGAFVCGACTLDPDGELEVCHACGSIVCDCPAV